MRVVVLLSYLTYSRFSFFLQMGPKEIRVELSGFYTGGEGGFLEPGDLSGEELAERIKLLARKYKIELEFFDESDSLEEIDQKISSANVVFANLTHHSVRVVHVIGPCNRPDLGIPVYILIERGQYELIETDEIEREILELDCVLGVVVYDEDDKAGALEKLGNELESLRQVYRH